VIGVPARSPRRAVIVRRATALRPSTPPRSARCPHAVRLVGRRHATVESLLTGACDPYRTVVSMLHRTTVHAAPHSRSTVGRQHHRTPAFPDAAPSCRRGTLQAVAVPRTINWQARTHRQPPRVRVSGARVVHRTVLHVIAPATVPHVCAPVALSEERDTEPRRFTIGVGAIAQPRTLRPAPGLATARARARIPPSPTQSTAFPRGSATAGPLMPPLPSCPKLLRPQHARPHHSRRTCAPRKMLVNLRPHGHRRAGVGASLPNWRWRPSNGR
jgi:hypothetical protein